MLSRLKNIHNTNNPLTLGEPLDCPWCGGEFLHQLRAIVFWRPREDAETGIRVETAERVLLFDQSADMAENPSSRRDGLIIEFECETCHHEEAYPAPWLRLVIEQHKGNTFMYWME